MEEKVSLTVTPEEARALLVGRIERMLRESGVALTPAERDRLAAALPLAGSGTNTDGRTSVSSPIPPSRVADVKRRALEQSGNRAHVYRPTSKAHDIEHPTSKRERLVSAIVKLGMCTRDDLERATKLPRKAIYTGVWELQKDGLIEAISVSDL